MKRTQKIVLVLSGALITGALIGCNSADRPVRPPPGGSGISYTNNQYVQGVGYFHQPYGAWYLLPYNYHDGRGWYRGGRWYSSPTMDTVHSSWSSSGGSHGSWGSSSDSGGSSSSGGSVSRGGFGGSGSGHGGSGGGSGGGS